MTTLTKQVYNLRMGQRKYLYTLTAQYLGLSSEINYWMLPDVHGWEITNDGMPIIPAIVTFYPDPTIYWTQDRHERFYFHLMQGTNARWELDFDHLAEGFILASRLSKSAHIQKDPDSSTVSLVQFVSPDIVENQPYKGYIRRVVREIWDLLVHDRSS